MRTSRGWRCPARRNKMISREEVRAALTGPFPSLNVPFNRDGGIDYGGLRNVIDRAIAGGAKTALLTWGDSLYSSLTDDEVTEVTRVVAEHAAGRAMVVAADNQWWTGKTVEFAKYCREVGADVLMVLPPNWGRSCTVETFLEHYAAIAEHIPVMVVTNAFAPALEQGLETLAALQDGVDGVVAVKDDVGGEFARTMTAMVGDRLAVFSGGKKRNHLAVLDSGAVGYMSTFILFDSSVTREYWQAVQRRDRTVAERVIEDHDDPFFEYILSLRGGFDAGMHGLLELCGIAGRWRRMPYYSLTDGEMEALANFCKTRGWL